jgi:hypothetical protein
MRRRSDAWTAGLLAFRSLLHTGVCAQCRISLHSRENHQFDRLPGKSRHNQTSSRKKHRETARGEQISGLAQIGTIRTSFKRESSVRSITKQIPTQSDLKPQNSPRNKSSDLHRLRRFALHSRENRESSVRSLTRPLQLPCSLCLWWHQLW